jgi:DNA repair exonuclease SbcCD ATPase subunit
MPDTRSPGHRDEHDPSYRHRRKSRSRSPPTYGYGGRKYAKHWGDGSGSAPAGFNKSSTYRPGGDLPGGYRNQPTHDPRRPRIDTSLPSERRPSATLSASGVDDREKAPSSRHTGTDIGPSTSGHTMDPRRRSINGRQGESNQQSDRLADLLVNFWDAAADAGRLVIKKENAQFKRDREDREAKKFESTTSSYPSASEQREDEKRKSAELIRQIEAKLNHHYHIRDAVAKELSVHMASINQKAPVEPNQPSTPAADKLIDELTHMKSKLESKSADSSALRRLEGDMAELKKTSKTNSDKLNVLREEGIERSKAFHQLEDKVKHDITSLQGDIGGLRSNMSQFQTQLANPPKHLDEVKEKIQRFSTSVESLEKAKVTMETEIKNIREQKSREIVDAEVKGKLAEYESETNRLQKELKEVKDDVRKQREEVNKRDKRALQASRPPSEGIVEDIEAVNRLEKTEKAVQKLEQQLTNLSQYQIKKEDLLSEEMEGIQTRNEKLETDIHKTQADILKIGSHLDKISTRLEQVEQRPSPPARSTSNTPHPPSAQTGSPTTALSELQGKFTKIANILAQVQQQTQAYMQTLQAQTAAIQSLESRYNNLTTEDLHRAMIQHMQEMYPHPHAAELKPQIEIMKQEIKGLQATRAPENTQSLQECKDQIALFERELRDLTSKYEEGESKMAQEEGTRLGESRKLQEECDELFKRIEETKTTINDVQNVLTTQFDELSVRMDTLERHLRVRKHTRSHSAENFADDISAGTAGAERRSESADSINGHGEADRSATPRKRAKLAGDTESNARVSSEGTSSSTASRQPPLLVRSFLKEEQRKKKRKKINGDGENQ